MRTSCFALLFAAAGAAQAAEGLRLPGLEESPRWQARVQLLSSDALSGTRVLSANLLGDYYLSERSQGLRLSGGVMSGPMSLLGSGAGLALGGAQQPLSLGQRSLAGSTNEAALHQPYLGIGYSSQGLGWGFSADLGVAMRGGNGLSLRNSSAFAQSLDQSLRALQFTPLVQMGLFYRF